MNVAHEIDLLVQEIQRLGSKSESYNPVLEVFLSFWRLNIEKTFELFILDSEVSHEWNESWINKVINHKHLTPVAVISPS